MNNNYTKNQAESVQDLATEMLKQFETKTRDGGESFDTIKDSAPDWMTDVVHNAHGRSMPDDYKYKFIIESLQAIADYDNEDEAKNSIESDFLSSGLLHWLSSSLDRASYVDSAVEEFGVNTENFNIMNTIGLGQLAEKYEVFDSVISSLEERLEEIEAA